MYSFSFSPAFAWHGNHIWFHSFVRRRRWLRKRVKLPTRTTRDGVKGDGSSLTDTIGRAGHGLNNDYFTIHSRKDRSSWNAAGSQDRPSVIQGSDWGGEDDSDEEVEFKDVGTLMKVVKKARLDREKIEAVMKFVEQGGDDVVYLADKVSQTHSLDKWWLTVDTDGHIDGMYGVSSFPKAAAVTSPRIHGPVRGWRSSNHNNHWGSIAAPRLGAVETKLSCIFRTAYKSNPQGYCRRRQASKQRHSQRTAEEN